MTQVANSLWDTHGAHLSSLFFPFSPFLLRPWTQAAASAVWNKYCNLAMISIPRASACSWLIPGFSPLLPAAQPEWLKVISDTEADIGANLRWGCAAAGKPRPTVRWLRNGEPLASQVSARGLPL